MKKIVGLQYLRAVAAIGVVIAHATGRFGEPWLKGVAGVDLFFLISGFMMFLITDENTRPCPFAFDRFTRVVPLYWLVTTVMLAGALLGLFPRITLTLEYIIKSYLFLPVRAPSSAEILPIVPHGWTLNYEMMFYSVFLLLLLAPERLRASLFTAVTACAVALGTVQPPANVILHAWMQPVTLEFAAGALVAHIWKRRAPQAACVGFLLIICGILLLVALPSSESSIRVLYFGVPAFLVLIGVLLMETVIRARAKFSALILLGDASYSIYLWHGLLVSLSVAIVRLLNLPSGVGVILATTVGVFFGTVAHLWLEKPLLALLRASRRSLSEAKSALAGSRLTAPPSKQLILPK